MELFKLVLYMNILILTYFVVTLFKLPPGSFCGDIVYIRDSYLDHILYLTNILIWDLKIKL